MAQLKPWRKEHFAKYRMFAKYFPKDAKATTNDYLCSTNDQNRAAKSYPETPVSTYDAEHDEIHRKESGKYVISFHVKDAAGNREAMTKRRTVIVKDTLPPVITLHLKNKLIHTSAGKQSTPANFYKVLRDPSWCRRFGWQPQHLSHGRVILLRERMDCGRCCFRRDWCGTSWFRLQIQG